MRASDLAPLLSSNGDSGSTFHQGVVQTYDPDTGESTIAAAGATFTNLPILSTGEQISIGVGDVVLLLRLGSTYFIVGRVVSPDSTAWGSTSFRFDSIGGTASNFAIPNAGTEVASYTVPRPAWANQALVDVTASLSIFPPASSGNLSVFASVNMFGGSVSGESAATCPDATWTNMSARGSVFVDLWDTDVSLTVSVGVRTAVGTVAANTNTSAQTDGMIIWRHVRPDQ